MLPKLKLSSVGYLKSFKETFLIKKKCKLFIFKKRIQLKWRNLRNVTNFET